jgi:molybdopterin synthase catalytic subunit
MAAVTIEVKLFAGLREAAGTGSLDVELPDPATARGLVEQLCERPGLGEVLRRMPVRVAVNRTYVEDGFGLSEGDEVALVPPISGGAPVRAAVTDRPLDAGALLAEAGDPAAGAVLLFQGTTRDVARLEYEAYGEMAEQRIAQILQECREKHGLTGAVAEHRIGEVALGEASIVVAVSAPHRGEAFAGGREAIDRIKAEAPVWKVEVEADGERRRVEGTLPPADAQGASR